MIRIGPRTIRAKLTLITMLVMGGLLGVFGLSVDVLARNAVVGSIDADLHHRAQMFSHPPGPPLGMAGDHGPGDHGPGDHGPGGLDGPGSFFGDGLGHGPGPDHGDMFWMDDPGHSPDGGQQTRTVTSADLAKFRAMWMAREQKVTKMIAEERKKNAGTANANSDLPPQNFWVGGKNNPQDSYDWEAYRDAKITHRPILKTITLAKDGKEYRLLTTPVLEKGKLVKIVEVADSLDQSNKALADLRRVLVTLIIPVGMVLSGLASLYLIDRLTKPLRSITHNAASIGSHNAAERLPVVGRDEFASVATTLNGMLDRLEAGLRLEQMTNRRLEQTVVQQRRFTEDASHELKTPLAVIKANTGLMLHYGGTEEEMRESVETIEAAADRMNRLVQDLLVLARAEAGQLAPRFEPADLGAIVQDSIGHLAYAKDRVKVSLPAGPLPVSASSDDLSRVFVNLIDNALRHSGSACPVEVIFRQTETYAVAEVRDRGEGIAAEHLPRLFDRFYRIDRSRSTDTGGTGLGLAICKGIVEAHKGLIEVTSVLGQGTVFSISIPNA